LAGADFDQSGGDVSRDCEIPRIGNAYVSTRRQRRLLLHQLEYHVERHGALWIAHGICLQRRWWLGLEDEQLFLGNVIERLDVDREIPLVLVR
jgi:hypothetical protein